MGDPGQGVFCRQFQTCKTCHTSGCFWKAKTGRDPALCVEAARNAHVVCGWMSPEKCQHELLDNMSLTVTTTTTETPALMTMTTLCPKTVCQPCTAPPPAPRPPPPAPRPPPPRSHPEMLTAAIGISGWTAAGIVLLAFIAFLVLHYCFDCCPQRVRTSQARRNRLQTNIAPPKPTGNRAEAQGKMADTLAGVLCGVRERDVPTARMVDTKARRTRTQNSAAQDFQKNASGHYIMPETKPMAPPLIPQPKTPERKESLSPQSTPKKSDPFVVHYNASPGTSGLPPTENQSPCPHCGVVKSTESKSPCPHCGAVKSTENQSPFPNYDVVKSPSSPSSPSARKQKQNAAGTDKVLEDFDPFNHKKSGTTVVEVHYHDKA